MITLTVKEWAQIRKQMKAEYQWKPSMFLIRDTMRKELGFTPRLHSSYSNQTGMTEVVYLDFYSEEKETMFRLKYL